MGEDRYVVRDRDGHYWRYAPDGVALCGIRRSKMCRNDALSLKRHPIARECGVRMFKVKPKPKAPREVFVVIDCDGRAADCSACEDKKSAEGLATHKGDRVVRYVLAEGE